MRRAHQSLLGLLAMLAYGAPLGPARADEKDGPMPPALRSTAEQAALRGQFSLLVRDPDYARWVSIESMPAPLNRWRIDIGWQAGRDGAVGLAPLAPREEPSCGSLQQPHALPELEGWGVVRALLTERCWRETHGVEQLPAGSPLAALPDPDGTIARFFAVQQRVYHPVPAEQSPDPSLAAEARAARELADSLRSSSRLWALLSAGLLLSLALGLGLRLRPSRPGT